MKTNKRLMALILAVILMLCACGKTNTTARNDENVIANEDTNTDEINQNEEEDYVEEDSEDDRVKPDPGILICGEYHSVKQLCERELNIWGELYANGVRHLFMEHSYAFAQYLNEWMRADNDEILNMLFEKTAGTAGSSQVTWDFLQKIKSDYPKTIFHGTDIEHQFQTIGAMYHKKLEEEGKKDTEAYQICRERIEQGKQAYKYDDKASFYACREKYMIENFIKEYDSIPDEFVMGIYGAAHTDPADKAPGGLCDSMAFSLKEKYGDLLQFEYMWYIDPIRTDKITVCGKEYDATYFGNDLPELWGNKCISWEVWRIENAYDDFKDKPDADNWLQYNTFRTTIELGQVFMFRVTYSDGTFEEHYYRSDEGQVYDGVRYMVEFLLDE